MQVRGAAERDGARPLSQWLHHIFLVSRKPDRSLPRPALTFHFGESYETAGSSSLKRLTTLTKALNLARSL